MAIVDVLSMSALPSKNIFVSMLIRFVLILTESELLFVSSPVDDPYQGYSKIFLMKVVSYNFPPFDESYWRGL